MKVILNEDIETLGGIGDIVEVKPGYARNYLFPRKFAVEVNKHNLEVMKIKKQKIQKRLELEKLSAVDQKQKLDEITLTFERKAGENEVLFGSVTVTDIDRELQERGIKIEKKKFRLDEPIKKLGNYSCKIRLFQDVEAEVKIEVLPEEGEIQSSGEVGEEENVEEAGEVEKVEVKGEEEMVEEKVETGEEEKKEEEEVETEKDETETVQET